MARLSETCRFLQSSSFWEARHALIGQLSSTLCLAEYLKRGTEMLHPLPYCDAVSQHDDTKTIKLIINKAFVASSGESGDIITDYNDFYCLFMHRVASRRINITMSVFVIRETTTIISTLLKTRVWIVTSRNVLAGCQTEAPDCPYNTAEVLKVPPFIAYTFGRCYANLPTLWRRHVGACLNEPF